MSDEQTNFKVTDRRLFNTDGSPRDLPEEQKAEMKATATAETARTAQAARPAAEKVTDQSAVSEHSEVQPLTEEEVEIPDTDDPTSFVNFMMSIASNGAACLGMMEHPVTHKREVDLELAKHWIDILGMLQQKTKGNLSAQEAKILDGLLADLRMQYVSLTSSASAKTPRTFTGRDIVGG